MNCIANDSKCTKFRNIYFLFASAPEEKIIIWCMLQWIMKVNKVKGFLQSGVLQPGVLTIKGSQNQGFLQSGACISVYLTWQVCAQLLMLIIVPYSQGFKSTCLTWQVCVQMLILITVPYIQGFKSTWTGLCPDIYIDHKILQLGVCVDHKSSAFLWSDVDIDLTMSHSCETYVLTFILMVKSYI